MSKKPSIFQPDHLGRHTPMALHPATVVSHQSHGLGADQAARHGDRPNIARDGGKGKLVRPTPIHGGMTRRQLALKGMQHANESAPDANPASPLSKEPAGKAFIGRAVGVNPGTRSRADDDMGGGGSPFTDVASRQGHARARHAEAVEIGRRVLAEAVRTK
jgi:hypothetical protein